MRLKLFFDGQLRDKSGRVFRVETADIAAGRLGIECALCTESRVTGYATTTRAGGREFVCADCSEIVSGAFARTVLVQLRTAKVWTGAAWSDAATDAKVFDTRQQAEDEHERFGRGKHISLVGADELSKVLGALRAELRQRTNSGG